MPPASHLGTESSVLLRAFPSLTLHIATQRSPYLLLYGLQCPSGIWDIPPIFIVLTFRWLVTNPSEHPSKDTPFAADSAVVPRIPVLRKRKRT